MWGGRAGSLLRGWGRQLTGAPGRRLLNCRAASQAGNSAPRCWKCGGPRGPAQGDGFFCPQCRALQPPDATRDYFSLMDCNRSFRIDTTKLQHRYQQLQRLVHPDLFSQRSQLKLHGIEISEGTDYEMDSQFLMEIMEINEKLAEAQNEAVIKEIESIVRGKQKEFTENVSRAFEQDDFEKAKEILTKMRYFSNVEEKIKLKKTPL
ncbi:iron-sulfur cluster co-chaperone protein HscB, mitochondrial isoform X3 [Octodon degus]|uniref:Iron-sulfur cluster co-chaperone protein HscB, mitochondrial isoform X3 n=1 Tax=Octodon degus TaxID=10160 RepID=A0A6P6E5J9_OCTDE|nr:iron-sulfur cluster co-chaperone protein HscB, mitochondrial isoform X3 [Octodon degus]